MSTNEIDACIDGVFAGMPVGTEDERNLRSILTDLQDCGCRNIYEKLVASKKARVSGRFGNLMAELKFARLVGRQLGAEVELHTGDAADISFFVDGVHCLLEVIHKSDPSPWSMVFHPLPEDRAAYAGSSAAWKQAAVRFHKVIDSLPIAIQPWLGREFLQPYQSGPERNQQELACGELANWLADNIERAFKSGVAELRYKNSSTYFELTRVNTAPGYMKGFASNEAWFLPDDDSFSRSIEEKARKARLRLHATGAQCYFIGMAIDEAIASRGHSLLNTLFGPLRYEPFCEQLTVRAVPPSCKAMFEHAVARGRRYLLEFAEFDTRVVEIVQHSQGVFLKESCVDVGGVIAIYYTDAIQFVPNPFTSNPIEQVRIRFPKQPVPFLCSTGTLRGEP